MSSEREAQIAYIEKHYEHGVTRDIAEKLGLTPERVRDIARRIGVRKANSPTWRKEKAPNTKEFLEEPVTSDGFRVTKKIISQDGKRIARTVYSKRGVTITRNVAL